MRIYFICGTRYTLSLWLSVSADLIFCWPFQKEKAEEDWEMVLFSDAISLSWVFAVPQCCRGINKKIKSRGGVGEHNGISHAPWQQCRAHRQSPIWQWGWSFEIECHTSSWASSSGWLGLPQEHGKIAKRRIRTSILQSHTCAEFGGSLKFSRYLTLIWKRNCSNFVSWTRSEGWSSSRNKVLISDYSVHLPCLLALMSPQVRTMQLLVFLVFCPFDTVGERPDSWHLHSSLIINFLNPGAHLWVKLWCTHTIWHEAHACICKCL